MECTWIHETTIAANNNNVVFDVPLSDFQLVSVHYLELLKEQPRNDTSRIRGFCNEFPIGKRWDKNNRRASKNIHSANLLAMKSSMWPIIFIGYSPGFSMKKTMELPMELRTAQQWIRFHVVLVPDVARRSIPRLEGWCLGFFHTMVP